MQSDIRTKSYPQNTISTYRDRVLLDGLVDTEHRRKSRFPSWLHTLVRCYLLLRELLQELRSLFARIRIVCKRRPYLVRFGPAIEVLPTGHQQPCRRTHACIKDRENFFASRPWATLVDVETFVMAWNKGVEWHAGIVDSCSPETPDS
jgi:hypothetical protein